MAASEITASELAQYRSLKSGEPHFVVSKRPGRHSGGKRYTLAMSEADLACRELFRSGDYVAERWERGKRVPLAGATA